MNDSVTNEFINWWQDLSKLCAARAAVYQARTDEIDKGEDSNGKN